VRAFFADDQPHSLRPALEAVAVEFGDPGAVTDFSVGFGVRGPALLGQLRQL
jgi:hypothetical protein